jgi:hypothetical protein
VEASCNKLWGRSGLVNWESPSKGMYIEPSACTPIVWDGVPYLFLSVHKQRLETHIE